ncbi:PD-(D/E)XK nuclease domain-containing protein [Halapricum hydrolyticum]|uniref:Uncharacterized protein n=1 Tax=Halapricum hydrolyticum TaxID=2979991 RepID=A0AAE3LK93_9EURY|nr:hypothetical protein [Halapricum hydrolyticum]MCU4719079.1 hypothetical protein [Halapricum hydrolyticum]MCU4728148.1 hypothetical protein [Halapricum hydrolyticum]
MHNGFSSFQSKKAPDSDKNISTVLRISERDSGIELSISYKEAIKSGTSFKTQQSCDLTLSGLSAAQVLDIVQLLEEWIESESHPTVKLEMDDVDGLHTYEESESYGRSRSHEIEFTEVTISVSKQFVEFVYWNDSKSEWVDVSIPSSEVVDHGVPQDIQNVTKLYQTFYDFFTIEYSGKTDYFEEEGPISSERPSVYQIEQIFNRFGEISIPLRERRGDREPLTIDDEADVQYLLHALLKLYFDDVRREPHTERHSSVDPRIDFLIQDETIGIEVKRASPTRREKSLRKELSEDKEQYRLDTNIDTLLIFVYDPLKQIENKAEFEGSFEQETPQMKTKVTVTR